MNSLPAGVKNNIVGKGDSRLFTFDSHKLSSSTELKRWRLNPFETASRVFIAGPAEIDDPSAGIPYFSIKKTDRDTPLQGG